MKRDQIEKVTASLVIVLVSVFSLGIILIFANTLFQWDIFTPFVEKVLYFIGFAAFIVILAAAVVNIMLNISRLAFFAQKIAERITKDS